MSSILSWLSGGEDAFGIPFAIVLEKGVKLSELRAAAYRRQIAGDDQQIALRHLKLNLQ